jgi:hypothetical protein
MMTCARCGVSSPTASEACSGCGFSLPSAPGQVGIMLTRPLPMSNAQRVQPTAGDPAGAQPLPPGWERKFTADGRAYYEVRGVRAGAVVRCAFCGTVVPARARTRPALRGGHALTYGGACASQNHNDRSTSWERPAPSAPAMVPGGPNNHPASGGETTVLVHLTVRASDRSVTVNGFRLPFPFVLAVIAVLVLVVIVLLAVPNVRNLGFFLLLVVFVLPVVGISTGKVKVSCGDAQVHGSEEQERAEREREREQEMERERERTERERTERERTERERIEREREREREREFLAPPQHWTSSRGAASAGNPLSFIKVRDDGVKAILQELLNGTGIGNGGRDQQQPGAFPLRSLLCSAHQFFILELNRSRIDRWQAVYAGLASLLTQSRTRDGT